MARSGFKGSVTTTGKSEAIRLDKALFKAHPEFKPRAKVQAHVLGQGSILITLESNTEAAPAEDAVESDPVVSAYLSFLERDMVMHPERLQPFTEEEIRRTLALTKGFVTSDDDVIPDDVSL
jgi:antitoxin PrlF